MENHGSLVPLARHCPLADDPSVSVAPNMMEVILVATRHLFTAMEIYGSLVILARHCPNIEDRCFSRQVWRRGRAFEVALTVSVRAPARGPRPLAPPLRSGHPVKGAHPLHNPRSNPTL